MKPAKVLSGIFLAAPVCAVLLSGCRSQQPVNMAPPISGQMQSGAPPVNQQDQGYAQNQGGQGSMQGGGQPNMQGGGQQTASVYQWQDVPQGQQVPVTRATFDQGGYQILANSGETIVVPFVNQKLYALKFGRTSGQTYFVNDGTAPVLYLAPGSYLENAAAQNARWYPIPNDYAYTQPMYVSVAPSWGEYVAMGWYPGMSAYGGMWGYSPYAHFAWMPGFYVGIGGARYTSFVSYHSYYSVHPGYYRSSVVYHNYGTPRGSVFGSRSVVRTGGGFGTRRTFGSPSGSTGSFRSNTNRTFGSGTRATGGSGFGSGARATGGSGFGSGARATGGSFGGGRSSGGSFGGGRTSGGSSFGGGRSSGGSFGGRRR